MAGEIILETGLTLSEQQQVITACWNKRAKLERQLKEREKKGKTGKCSTHKRVELLTSAMDKLQIF